MNERIEQLAIQSGFRRDMFGLGVWDTPEFQKFAELIVRDCSCVPIDMWGEGQLQTEWAGKVQQRILKHFGVEE